MSPIAEANSCVNVLVDEVDNKLGLVFTSKKQKPITVRPSSFPTAGSFYLAIKKGKLNIHSLKKQDRNRAYSIVKHFDCFTTEKEKTILNDKTSDQTQINQIIKHITLLIVNRYRAIFEKYKSKVGSVPKPIRNNDLKTTSLENMQMKLRKHAQIVINPTPTTFMKFRKMFEKKQNTDTTTDTPTV